MNGSHLGDALSAFLDGELGPGERAAAESHLTACDHCRSELDRAAVARAQVRALPSVEPPAGWRQRMLQQRPAAGVRGPAATGVPLQRRRRAAVAALVASAAASVTLLRLVSGAQTPVTPAVGRLVEAHAATASVEGDPLTQLAPVGVPVSLGR